MNHPLWNAINTEVKEATTDYWITLHGGVCSLETEGEWGRPDVTLWSVGEPSKKQEFTDAEQIALMQAFTKEFAKSYPRAAEEIENLINAHLNITPDNETLQKENERLKGQVALLQEQVKSMRDLINNAKNTEKNNVKLKNELQLLQSDKNNLCEQLSTQITLNTTLAAQNTEQKKENEALNEKNEALQNAFVTLTRAPKYVPAAGDVSNLTPQIVPAQVKEGKQSPRVNSANKGQGGEGVINK